VAKSWEQQEGETEEWHGRFLAFLGMGPGRTLLRAYRLCHPDGESAAVSGPWRTEARARQWQKRANDFDLSAFKEIAREAAATYSEAIRHLGKKALAAMASELPEMQPRSWDEALGAFAYLGGLFPADTIVGLVGESERQGDPPPAAKSAGAQGIDADGYLIEIPEEDFPVHGGDPWNPPAATVDGSPFETVVPRPTLLPGETAEQHLKRTGFYPKEQYDEPKPPKPPKAPA
jgi:hypothetical protein